MLPGKLEEGPADSAKTIDANMYFFHDYIICYYRKMEKSFIHLHTHSHYSLLDGLSKLEDLIELAKKAGIKPIIGVEAYVAERGRQDKEPNLDNKRYHLTLLVKNLTGYKNLM